MSPHTVLAHLVIAAFSAWLLGVGMGILYAEARARIRGERKHAPGKAHPQQSPGGNG